MIDDAVLVGLITERACKLMPVEQAPFARSLWRLHQMVWPLRLQEMLEAPDHQLAHDVYGILHHFDPETGSLGAFVPRYAVPGGRFMREACEFDPRLAEAFSQGQAAVEQRDAAEERAREAAARFRSAQEDVRALRRKLREAEGRQEQLEGLLADVFPVSLRRFQR